VDIQNTKWEYTRNRRIRIFGGANYINRHRKTGVYDVSEKEERKQKESINIEQNTKKKNTYEYDEKCV